MCDFFWNIYLCKMVPLLFKTFLAWKKRFANLMVLFLGFSALWDFFPKELFPRIGVFWRFKLGKRRFSSRMGIASGIVNLIKNFHFSVALHIQNTYFWSSKKRVEKWVISVCLNWETWNETNIDVSSQTLGRFFAQCVETLSFLVTRDDGVQQFTLMLKNTHFSRWITTSTGNGGNQSFGPSQTSGAYRVLLVKKAQTKTN